jgi:hypothetical protein
MGAFWGHTSPERQAWVLQPDFVLTAAGPTTSALPALPAAFLFSSAVSSTSTGLTGFSSNTCQGKITQLLLQYMSSVCTCCMSAWNKLSEKHLDNQPRELVVQRPSICRRRFLQQSKCFLHLGYTAARHQHCICDNATGN